MSKTRIHASEDEEQVAIFNWTQWQDRKHPELRLLFHIPNGGHRHVSVARQMKEQGVRAGVPDMFLPVARGRFHGLFIELKVGRNKTTKQQDEWLNELSVQGYATIVCYGFEQAKEALTQYLNMDMEGKQ